MDSNLTLKITPEQSQPFPLLCELKVFTIEINKEQNVPALVVV